MAAHPAGTGTGVSRDQRLAGARLAEQEHAGVGGQPARSQASGSRQTTSPPSWCRPTGVPASGAPAPAMNGYRPQACTVVAWYLGGGGDVGGPPAVRELPAPGGRQRDPAGRVACCGARRGRLVPPGHRGHLRASAGGQIPHGKVAANPAAWLMRTFAAAGSGSFRRPPRWPRRRGAARPRQSR